MCIVHHATLEGEGGRVDAAMTCNEGEVCKSKDGLELILLTRGVSI